MVTTIKQGEVPVAEPNSTASKDLRKPTVKKPWAKPNTNDKAPIHFLKLYEEPIVVSKSLTAIA